MNEAPDPSTFPHPEWATYTEQRKPKFKTHNGLGQAKNAVNSRNLQSLRGTTTRNYPVYEHALEESWVYQWDFEKREWVQRFHIPEGSYWSDNPLSTFTSKRRKGKPVTDDEIQRALASIAEGVH